MGDTGKPDAGNLPVRFDEGQEPAGGLGRQSVPADPT
jgi:hypothetical protein